MRAIFRATGVVEECVDASGRIVGACVVLEGAKSRGDDLAGRGNIRVAFQRREELAVLTGDEFHRTVATYLCSDEVRVTRQRNIGQFERRKTV